MAYKSMTEVAYKTLNIKRSGQSFADLWKEVCVTLEYNESQSIDKLSKFYNDIMLDSRFVLLNNKWHLRKRRKYDEIHIDTSAIILEDVELIEDDICFDEEDEESEDF